MADHTAMKFGRQAPGPLPAGMSLHEGSMGLFLDKPAPDYFSCSTVGKAQPIQDWGMYRNDVLSDCVFAGIAHQIMLWSNTAGLMYTPPEDAIVGAYSAATGYDPAKPYTDQGTSVYMALKQFRDVGFDFGQGIDKLEGYAAVPYKRDKRNVLKNAMILFGGVGLGLVLPSYALRQDTWEIIAGGPEQIAGGHWVFANGYSPVGLNVITWGEPKTLRWEALDAWCDEAWAMWDTDYFKLGCTPLGLDFDLMTQVLRYLQTLG